MDVTEISQIVDRMLKGEIKPYRLGDYAKDENDAASIRRAYIERLCGSQFQHIGKTSIDFNDASKRNIENAIGAVQVPLGFIELVVTGEQAGNGKKATIFMATTEGKLIAGASRGASVINKSGGANVKIIKNSMTRSVILDTGSASASAKAMAFINSDEGRKLIEGEFAESSSHGRLIEAEAYTTGRLLFIRYGVDTKAAMGMNMVTIGSTRTTNALIKRLSDMGIESKFVSESGNLCTDKKPAMINVIKGRGVSVIAEAVIKKEVLEEYFKADALAIERLNYSKNYVGSGLAGSFAHNAHIANVLAATFLAYGQDVAQIVDGVNAIDDAKAEPNGDLYISVYIPALEVGTIGGGTGRETQKELLKASGVYGEGDESGSTKLKLAELIAAAALAGELNLLAAQAGGELSSAHASLKRKP